MTYIIHLYEECQLMPVSGFVILYIPEPTCSNTYATSVPARGAFDEIGLKHIKITSL